MYYETNSCLHIEYKLQNYKYHIDYEGIPFTFFF